MAESDPNCYPAESIDYSYEDHAEVHMEEEACVHVEDHIIESEAPVQEHVEPAPAEEHVEAPAVQEPGFDASAEAPAEDPNQPQG